MLRGVQSPVSADDLKRLIRSRRSSGELREYLSAALKMPDVAWDRSSGGQVVRKRRSSFIMERMFAAETSASDSSSARLEEKRRRKC